MSNGKQSNWVYRWRLGLWVVGGLGCLVLGGYRIYVVGTRPEATATIERHYRESYRDGNSRKSRDCYELSYRVDGQPIASHLCADRLLVGPTVTVLYDPETPSSAELTGASGLLKQGMLWGVAPLFAWFMAVGFGMSTLEDLVEKRRTAQRRERERRHKASRR